MDVEKPFTGETLGRVVRCEEEDVERAVLDARAAQAGWASTSLDRRGIEIRPVLAAPCVQQRVRRSPSRDF